MMLVPRRYLRSGAVLLSLAGLTLLFYSNSAVLPVGKPAWAPWFGEPGPPTSRDTGVHPRLPDTLTLHLVPHSHSDIGWNLSFEGYYHSVVRDVLRRVTAELWKDTRRKFTWGDLAFLDLWMASEGTESSGLKENDGKEITWGHVLRTLVQRGQMDIVGGTYVSPDEGLTTWWAHNTIVDTGHRTLHEILGTNTSVSWQIDNFGHFNTMPYLLANSGYSSLVLGRMAYRDLYDFSSKSSLQFRWRMPDKPGSLLTHFLSTHYAFPSRLLDFDHADQCNVDQLLGVLRKYALTQVRQYPAHGHILVMMGDDFRYTDAKRAFQCMDRLIAGNSLAGINIKYSTPTEYLSTISNLQPEFSVANDLTTFEGDFYPYQDKPFEQYWSGILASRPALKGLIRSSEQTVQHTEALVAVAKLAAASSNLSIQHDQWNILESHLEYCRKQVSIGYHHDAITGTCSDSARFDYVQRLKAARRVALRISQYALDLASSDKLANAVDSASAMNKRLRKDRISVKSSSVSLGYNTADNPALHMNIGGGSQEEHEGYLDIPSHVCSDDFCPGLLVTVTNAASLVPQNQIVRLVLSTLNATISDASKMESVTDIQIDRRMDGRFLVSFLAKDVPALGFKSYTISRDNTRGAPGLNQQFQSSVTDSSASSLANLSKNNLQVDLAVSGYRVRLSIRDTATGQTRVVWHTLKQYFANPQMQSSGAYIMHSFMLMYSIVIYIFGGSLCFGIILAFAVHRSKYLENIVPSAKHIRVPYIFSREAVATKMEIQAETETGGDRLSVDSSDSGDSLGSIEQQRVDTEYKPQSLKGTVGCEPNATIYHVLAGLLVGCLFIYFIEQKVDINRLDGWTIGQGHVFWLLVLPTSITAYVISGAMRWTSRQTTLFICSLAVGIVLTIFGMPSWQSRPLALSSSAGTELARKHGWLAKNLLKFEVEHGSLCDTARIWIDHQTEVTYSLCADKPSYVQVTTMLSADVNREVVAQFEIEQPFAATGLSERLFGCQFDIFNGVDVVRRQYNWWTPIPGNYYPAISHVSLLTNPRGDRHRSGFFTLHSRQAMGATCIKHNTIETMLHRSMSGNDFRGLVDPMVDNVPATITQFLDLGFGRDEQNMGLLDNLLINTPPLVFALPMNRTKSLSFFTGISPDAKLSDKALSLVGLQVSDTDLLNINNISVDNNGTATKLFIRILALPNTPSGSKLVSIPAAEFISTSRSPSKKLKSQVFAVEGGDWSIAPASTRKRSLQEVNDLEIPEGQQRLYRIDMQGGLS